MKSANSYALSGAVCDCWSSRRSYKMVSMTSATPRKHLREAARLTTAELAVDAALQMALGAKNSRPVFSPTLRPLARRRSDEDPAPIMRVRVTCKRARAHAFPEAATLHQLIELAHACLRIAQIAVSPSLWR